MILALEKPGHYSLVLEQNPLWKNHVDLMIIEVNGLMILDLYLIANKTLPFITLNQV